jgi:hypothetical protein
MGFAVVGLAFTATSATFAGIHIDFRNTTTMPQAFHILIESNFFSGGNQLHTDIHTGGGHNYTIRLNEFYKSNIAIRGYEQALTPAQSVQSCLVERNWFESFRGTCHIADPGAGWKITCNAVEYVTGSIGGFVRLLNATPGLSGVTIEDNWCGDVSNTATSGAQIEIAAGPFTIRNNLLAAGGTGSASIRAVGIINAGCHIEDNRYVGNTSGTFIDWGTFAHIALGAPNTYTGAIIVLGNSVPVLNSGTIPPRLVTDTGGGLDFPKPQITSATIASGVLALNPNVTPVGVSCTLGSNITTMTMAASTRGAQTFTIILVQGGAGTATVAWAMSTAKFAGGAGPAVAGAYAMTTVTFLWSVLSLMWIEIGRSVAVA